MRLKAQGFYVQTLSFYFSQNQRVEKAIAIGAIAFVRGFRHCTSGEAARSE